VKQLKAKRDVKALVWMIGRDLPNHEIEPAIEALAELRSLAIPELKIALGDARSGWKRRKNCALALGQTGDPDVIPILLAATGDEDRNIQQGACFGLQALGRTAAAQKFLIVPFLARLAASNASSIFTIRLALETATMVGGATSEDCLRAAAAISDRLSFYEAELTAGRLPTALEEELNTCQSTSKEGIIAEVRGRVRELSQFVRKVGL
jgi:hypothetical protein